METIRAFKVEPRCQWDFDNHTTFYYSTWFTEFSVWLWHQFQSNVITATFSGFVVFSCLLTDSGKLMVLSINQSINQISITPISPAKPGSVAKQPNRCSTAKSRKPLSAMKNGIYFRLWGRKNTDRPR